jgi:uncharacterized membrane protein YhaH (DUF805 family)
MGEITVSDEPMRFDLLLSFEGRIKRKLWWTVIPPIVLFNIIIDVLLSNYSGNFAMRIFHTAIIVVLLWPFFAVNAKRWHDRNKSGFWTFINIIPIFGLIWLFIECGCLKGTAGENDYGPEPK